MVRLPHRRSITLDSDPNPRPSIPHDSGSPYFPGKGGWGKYIQGPASPTRLLGDEQTPLVTQLRTESYSGRRHHDDKQRTDRLIIVTRTISSPDPTSNLSSKRREEHDGAFLHDAIMTLGPPEIDLSGLAYAWYSPVITAVIEFVKRL